MKQIIELYKSVVLQLATPFSVGTGFYLGEYQLIVTNEHVVHNNKEVVVEGKGFPRALAQVVYIDARYDLAFLKCSAIQEMPIVQLQEMERNEGDAVIAVGHPFGLKFTATQGIISNTVHQHAEINYLQHDAALNPGNSGGPLVDVDGKVIGVNTFIIQNGQNIGFSLPVKILRECLAEFVGIGSKLSVRCTACSNLVSEPNPEKKYCPNCGAEIHMISDIEDYQPTGIKLEIESILQQMGYDIRLTRRGPQQWEVINGSAKILLSYHEQSGMITGDALLCTLPKENIKSIYSYLLQQNHKLRNLSISLKGNDIILSLIVFDQYFKAETGAKSVQNLVRTANELDDYLVQEFGAIRRKDS